MTVAYFFGGTCILVCRTGNRRSCWIAQRWQLVLYQCRRTDVNGRRRNKNLCQAAQKQSLRYRFRHQYCVTDDDAVLNASLLFVEVANVPDTLAEGGHVTQLL